MGSLVEPEENWMNAMSSGCRPMGDAVRRYIGDLVQDHRMPFELREPFGETVFRGIGAQPVEHLALGGERRCGQAREHAEEFRLVLVGIAGRERYGDHAPEHTRPERVDERGEAVDQDDGLRIGARARGLQVTQQSERASVHFRVGNAALAGLAARCSEWR